MAKKKATRKTSKKTTRKARTTRTRTRAATELIISKSRTKTAASINVSGDFYSALDEAVREMIATAEQRAVNNGRKTLRPFDL